jgi:TolA-binding protein
VKELLPRTALAWAALAVISIVVAGLSFGVNDAAGITAVGAVAGLALLNVGRVARWVEPRRFGQQVQQAQQAQQAEVRDRLATLNADLDSTRQELSRLADQMSSLRLTVSQAASTIAQQRDDQPRGGSD